ncbi:bifunctional adenosylcobinamide kinase/adenosylcobinamide-phosphate guanylyltransferase [Synechococcus elongatus]|uniref:Adenosylcobinamide kinase n=1 Tax=Synechococcus elongatus PCC 11802 TaxID=2283154 RepID=A0AAT9JSU9_SYNEL|nr:bifunctional adenosylcobinamide kinase/adenosylcobinamide-phosphate guanylyltransferase [Synechococcus elongatus]QFZ92342.1 bifunctional adenosylcobinamide kinase/adenosylcobinamide-phosphate guanylyltransferase [Synechococcus elongatus PCC 11802]
MLTVVTGPSRSGKSEWAEELAHQSQQKVIYIATAQVDPEDPEWCDRISQHQQRRPTDWQTLNIQDELATVIATASDRDCLLIDSLGTWVAAYLDKTETDWNQQTQAFLAALHNCLASVIIVAEETGWGVVPAYPLGRQFRDRLGSLTRQVSNHADHVFLAVAGYAIDLKQLGVQIPESMYRNPQDLNHPLAD